MLTKLQNAERVCNAAAITSGVLLLAAISGTEPNGVAAIVALVLTIVMAVIAGRLRKQINRIQLEQHKRLPVNTTRATVVKRRVGYRYSYASGRSGTVRSGSPMYYVTFETERGVSMELYVSRDVYFAALEGKSGILRHKGDEFISFN